jgi:lipid A 4'-phosphatase
LSAPPLRFGPGTALAAAGAIALAALIVFPAPDLAVSSWFYEPGSGFPLAGLPLFQFVMRALPDLAIGATILAVLLGLAAWASGRVWAGVTPRIALFLGSSLAIGPGLLVNTLLKDHWGRARPHQILDFGGTAHFSPAVLLSDQCARNCAFPSGHAALGFWLIAFAAVVPERGRMPTFVAAMAIGVLVGMMRIAQGAHFLSDVIAAALLVAGVNYLLKKLILDRSDT